MMTLSHVAKASYYGRHLWDYFKSAGETVAVWFGRGAAALGLVGAVTRIDFEQLYRFFGPDGTKLRQDAGREDRLAALDVVFSPHKSISIVRGLEEPAYRKAIDEVQVAATLKALSFLEEHGQFTRVGRGGAVVLKGAGMVAAVILESYNRSLEPALHTHSVVFQLVLREDGKFGAPVGITAPKRSEDRKRTRSPFYALRKQADAVYQEEMRRGMEALGYRMERTPHGYAAADVPKELCRKWSSRRADILRDLEQRGKSGEREAALSGRMTRANKVSVPEEDLLLRWKREAGGFNPASIRSIQRTKEEEHGFDQGAQQEATNGRPAEESTGSHSSESKQTNRGGARTHQKTAHGASPHDSDDDKALRQAAKMARILRRAACARGQRLTRANVFLARKQTEFVRDIQFTKEERQGLLDVTRRRGAVQFLSAGPSEARVETVLAAARVAWSRQGYRVLLAAPSKSEADELTSKTGIHSVSTTGLLKGLKTNRGLLRGFDSATAKAMNLRLGFRTAKGFVNYWLKASGR